MAFEFTLADFSLNTLLLVCRLSRVYRVHYFVRNPTMCVWWSFNVISTQTSDIRQNPDRFLTMSDKHHSPLHSVWFFAIFLGTWATSSRDLSLSVFSIYVFSTGALRQLETRLFGGQAFLDNLHNNWLHSFRLESTKCLPLQFLTLVYSRLKVSVPEF